MGIPALPFCHISLAGQKPPVKAYPRELKTLGNHLRKRRLDLKLLQKDVAKIIDVDEATIWNWENSYTSPNLYYIPKIVEFLGYVPSNGQTKTLGEKIVRYRRLLGITQKELAKSLGIDPGTLGRWERNRGKPQRQIVERLKEFMDAPIDKSFS
jgi:transcriptional regulator with XRE-family HTH domain